VAKSKRRYSPAASAEDPKIRQLEAKFAAFRKTKTPGARIPGGLRSAVLEAIDGGLRPSQVCRACRLSASQLLQWRRALLAAPAVFAVTDDGVPSAADASAQQSATGTPSNLDFQFQLEGWVVRVCLNRPSQNRG